MTRETHVRTGIAGECCTEKKIINIEDAYQDSRFNQALDKASGSLHIFLSDLPLDHIVLGASL